MSMTVEDAIKQAIRCAVGGCSEDCPYYDSDNVCHASEGFAENLEKALSEFRELKEKATAIKSDGFSDPLLNMGYTKGMKDGYAKAIEEFAEQIKARAHSTERNDWSADYMISIWESVIDEIAMELKGE